MGQVLDLEWVKKYTKTDTVRLQAMADAVDAVKDIEGDIVECGVWRGGNIILARKLAPERICWLYDTFAGMPAPDPVDVTRSGKPAMRSYQARKEAGIGWCAASLDEVIGYLKETGTFDPNKLRFVEGDVLETLHQFPPEKIALLRLDTDWYASTKAELEVLYPRLQPGGILIIDDYGHWMGSQRAVKEYFGKDMPPMTWIDYSAIQIVKS